MHCYAALARPCRCPEHLSSLGMSDACTGKLCQKTASAILKLDQAQWRGKRHRNPPNHKCAAPNLTTNYGSPNRSNTGDPLMPYQSLAILGYVAPGNAMEIYGSRRRAEQTPLSPHPCARPRTN